MNKPEKKTECGDSLDCAEKQLHSSVSQDRPEWINEDGDCDSCISLEHEMAAHPTVAPEEIDPPVEDDSKQ